MIKGGHLRLGSLTYSVIGCAQKVHSVLGPGFPEAVYRRALCQELTKSKIPFREEAECEVAYDGLICGRFKVDVLVDERLVLELKAVESICDAHVAQTLSYVKATAVPVALLMNFGAVKLTTRRFVNKEDP